jgi:hypothetical protein
VDDGVLAGVDVGCVGDSTGVGVRPPMVGGVVVEGSGDALPRGLGEIVGLGTTDDEQDARSRLSSSAANARSRPRRAGIERG